MAAPVGVQVTGAKEFRAALKRMNGDLRDMQRTNKAATQPVAETARDLVPRITGTLQGTIRATATQTKGMVLAGSRAVPYAGPIHFGWPRRNISPQPFIYDAADKRRDDVVAIYNGRVEELVRRVGIES